MRFRAAEAESGWAAALACLAEAHSLAPEVDFRELVDDFLAAVPGSHARVADFLEQAAGSRGRADEPEVEPLVPAAGYLALADEPGVELLVLAADFRAWAAALADSAALHSHAPAVDSRELAARLDSPGLAHSRGPVADCRVPLVSRVVLRSAYSAALPAAFLLKVAAADWLAVLRLCLPAALEQASHSSRCETRSAWVSSAPRELLEPKAPSSSQPVCSQAFPGDAPMVSQEH